MKLPVYVTIEEVQRVCAELGIRDWTKLSEPKVEMAEAEKVLKEVNSGGMPIVVEDFAAGLEVELEHGLRFPDANVTNNHPVLTGMIVMAHFKESLDYYQRLDVAELEGDLLKALAAGDLAKAKAKYLKLTQAKKALSEIEARLLG
ncbi:MAG: hypothetical protein ABIK12_06605 [Pseudomonadota bacterium]